MYGLTLSMAALLGLTGAGLTAQAEATAAPDITIGAEKLSTDTESKDLTYADIAEMCMPSMVSIELPERSPAAFLDYLRRGRPVA